MTIGEHQGATERPLDNRCAIITGASRGLGREIAKRYLAAGAHVVICAREQPPLDEAMRDLNAAAAPGQLVIGVRADVADRADVTALVEQAQSAMGHVDILVNNAGIAGPRGPLESVDWNDWMRAIEINLLGSVLMSRALLPHFKQRGRGKIIQLSGGGATKPLPLQSAYAVSKAGIVRFVETLAEETRAHRIDVNALAPGALDTGFLGSSGPPRATVPLARGADLAVFLGSPRSDGITGKLISAVWDPWGDLPNRLGDLQGTDVYTLRRIVPRDRDMSWGDEL